MSSSGPAAARSPPTRFGRWRPPGSSRQSISSRPARSSARPRQARLPGAHWHDDPDTLPEDGPLLIVANEFFDALPVRQLVRDRGRMARADGRLRGRAFRRVPGPLRPGPAADAAPGTIVETCPAAAAIVGGLARPDRGAGRRRLDRRLRTLALRHGRHACRRCRAHGFADPWTEPGERDLTAHVDFEALGNGGAARGHSPGGSADPGRMARRDGTRPSRPGAGKDGAGAGRRDRRGTGSAGGAGSDGRFVQGDGSGVRRLAGSGGLRMSAPVYRDATAADAPLMADIGPRTLRRDVRPSLFDGESRRLPDLPQRSELAGRARGSALRGPDRGGGRAGRGLRQDRAAEPSVRAARPVGRASPALRARGPGRARASPMR